MINVRVYGILVNEKNEVLVTDELIRGMYITKFCGGGLEEGEGTRECLAREFMEEMKLPVEVGAHIYTTDFYQPSAFRAGDQILSIYYRVSPLAPITAHLHTLPFQFNKEDMAKYTLNGEIETFRLIAMNDFSARSMTLPIDKIVAEIVRDDFNRASSGHIE